MITNKDLQNFLKKLPDDARVVSWVEGWTIVDNIYDVLDYDEDYNEIQING